MALAYWDTHNHLGFVDDVYTSAKELIESSIGVFVATVTPIEYIQIKNQLATLLVSNEKSPGLVLGAGAHPWWISDGKLPDADLKMMLDIMSETPFISEVGLDYSQRFSEEQRKMQRRWFEAICVRAGQLSKDIKSSSSPDNITSNGECSSSMGHALIDANVSKPHDTCTRRVLSIHAVQSVQPVLEILQTTEVCDLCTCIFHWFSGSSSDLFSVLESGCYLSVNRQTLSAKRWKEYAKVIPQDRLLLETDMPPQAARTWSVQDELYELDTAFERLHALRGDITREILVKNTQRILGLDSAV